MISHFRHFLSKIYDASKRGIKKKAGAVPVFPRYSGILSILSAYFWSPAGL